MAQKPVLSNHPHTPNKIKSRPPEDVKDPLFSFSFRFFNQIQYFGFSGTQTKVTWFISLLERLKVLSARTVSSLLQASSEKGPSGYRFHAIDWSKRNVPIQREDLVWLRRDYLDNPESYPILQFQISKSLGRVVGFLDENSVFNILLLDPLHNIQPSKDYGYRVNDCHPLSCDYSLLKSKMENLHNRNCGNNNCDHSQCSYQIDIDRLLRDHSAPINALINYLDDDTAQMALSLVDEGKVKGFKEIFEEGILHLSEGTSSETLQ
jgi:hypothetical protein